jgi:hypothetical protein
VEEGDRIGFDPVRRTGQQQAEQLRVVQPVEQGRRYPARTFDVVRSRRDVGAEGLRPGDHRPIARKIGRVRDLSGQDQSCRTLVNMTFPGRLIIR